MNASFVDITHTAGTKDGKDQEKGEQDEVRHRSYRISGSGFHSAVRSHHCVHYLDAQTGSLGGGYSPGGHLQNQKQDMPEIATGRKEKKPY